MYNYWKDKAGDNGRRFICLQSLYLLEKILLGWISLFLFLASKEKEEKQTFDSTLLFHHFYYMNA